MHQRRLSSLVQQQADRFEAGRDNFLTAADKVYDSINGTLENSLQFVFGRFKEQASSGSPLPKTLEDARKLVSSPPTEEQEDFISTSGRSSPALEDPLSAGGNTKMLELIGGRKQLRERSVDSQRSGGSGKRVAFSEVAAKERQPEPTTPGANLFNAINPLNRFAVPGFARFGRSASGSTNNNAVNTPPPHPSPTNEKPNKLEYIVESPLPAEGTEPFPSLEKQRTRESVVSAGGDDLNAREALAELRKIKPPRKRFLEVKDAGELKIGEVEDLLADYRRLAKAIGEAIAS
jgi:hypothetical protein